MEIAGLAGRRMDGSVDADAMHAMALIDLVVGDTAGNLLGRTISSLEMVTRLSPDAAAPFVDLSAAYLARAAVLGDSRDVLAAAEASTHATELDPANSAARYNRAFALDLLGLDAEARAAWRQYLAHDSTSGWASEARERLRADGGGAIALPADDAPTHHWTSLALSSPGIARRFGWEQALPRWAEATVAVDAPTADRWLAIAATIGSTIERTRGDRSLSDAVARITAASGPGEAPRLAQAIADMARARQLLAANDPVLAEGVLRQVRKNAAMTGVLRATARFAHANALIYRGEDARGQALLDTLLAHPDSVRYPALMASALWSRGVLRLRADRHDAGLRDVSTSAALFRQVGDTEYEAAMVGLAGEALLNSGDDIAGFAGLHRATTMLRDHPTSEWRHGALYLLARAANAAGLTRASEAIERENAAAADAAGDPVRVVEARLGRARAQWTAGRFRDAGLTTDAAAQAIRTLPVGEARATFEAELQFTLATGPMSSDPALAYAMLDPVVDFYLARQRPVSLIAARLARARAALVLGRNADAERDLDAVASLYERREDEIADLPLAAALISMARPAFEALVMSRLTAGDTIGALAAVERGRATLARPPAAANSPPTPVSTAPVISYAVIGDTLLAWVVDARGTRFARTPVAAARLRQTVERVRVGLERGLLAEALSSDLEQLHDWIVAPVAKHLEPEGVEIVVVPDEALADVPFAALRDARRSRYVVEDRAVVMARTLAEAQARPRAAASNAASSRQTVFVADPALSWQRFPALAPLPEAVGEVRAAAAHYDRARILIGAEADSATIVAMLHEAEMFHFAGHAVFDETRPDRSFLALSPNGLSAAVLQRLTLDHLRLVVLSACGTMRSPERRTASISGLTDAFRAAGVGGVIGSLWRVDDANTSELMAAFHRSYRTTSDAAAALRAAQLTMLRSPDESQRSPGAWGAFHYTGQ